MPIRDTFSEAHFYKMVIRAPLLYTLRNNLKKSYCMFTRCMQGTFARACTLSAINHSTLEFRDFSKRAPYGVREGALRRKYMLFKKYIYFFKKHMFFGTYIFAEKHIFFVRPLLEHGVYEKVPCAHACARLSRLSFRALLTSG